MAANAKQAIPAISSEMVSAGVSALLALVPSDLAFPIGGAETAVEEILKAAFRAHQERR